MLLAPTPPMRAVLGVSPSGTAQVMHTLGLMRASIRASRVNPAVIQAAVSIIYTTPERDELSEITALFEYVRDHIRYVRDVHGVETLTTPEMTLQRRVGDCDDQTTLLCALCESVGYPTRLIAAGYNDPRAYEHVYCQILARGIWIDADPIEHEPLGYAPPGALIQFIESV